MQGVTKGPPGFEQVTFCGAGATSRVFRAVESASGRVVALKRLHKQLVRDEKALARLKREFEALRKLRHRCLVPVSDVVTWEGDPTLVMDFVDGQDLKEYILQKGQLPSTEVETIARALFDALSLTHGSGIVHRDIKPQNVRITADGGIYLLDFGSARLDASSQLTATGTTVGTPDYMAPELFAGPVYDPRVDIYGVGATLYECLTGAPPQHADSLAELAHLRATADVPPVRERGSQDIVDSLARVVDRCLARAPEDRFPSATLALWSLDHSEAERALCARRSANPLCLHCGRAIAKENARCPLCHAEAPFRYPKGACHVNIQSVESPTAFLEYVGLRFPERADFNPLCGLTERIAALSYGSQRYVSFIGDAAAEALVRELAGVGVRAEVVRELSWEKNLILGFFTFPYFLLFRPLLSLWDAASGMLSTSGGSRPVMPRVMRFWACAFGMFVLSCMVRPQWAWGAVNAWIIAHEWSLASYVSLMLASVYAFPIGLIMRFWNPTIKAAPVEPPLEDRLPQTLFASRPKGRARSVGDAAPRALVALIPFVVALECAGICLLDRNVWMNAIGDVPVVVVGHDGVTQAKVTKAASTPAAKTTITTALVASTTPARVANERAVDGSSHAWPIVDFIAIQSLTVMLLFLMAHRRTRIRKDTAAMIAELDLPAFARLAARVVPERDANHGLDAFGGVAVSDAFGSQAALRAANLVPLLSNEHAESLIRAVDAMNEGRPSPKASDGSLLARCILETDPHQKLRFEFLALEGRYEAEAATEWLDQVHRAGAQRT